MLSIKFLAVKENRNDTINKIISGTNNFIKKFFSTTELTEDDYGMEIFAGDQSSERDNVFVEITVKKRICINIKDLNEKDKLDRVVSEIKFLCEKSNELDKYYYKPINFRK